MCGGGQAWVLADVEAKRQPLGWTTPPVAARGGVLSGCGSWVTGASEVGPLDPLSRTAVAGAQIIGVMRSIIHVWLTS